MTEDVLQSDEIQGNSLGGFNKPHQAFLALVVENLGRFKGWLKDLADAVTPVTEVVRHKQLRNELRLRLGSVPPSLSATWLNIALSAKGLSKLRNDVASLPDPSFLNGMAAASRGLGDWTTEQDPGHPSKWIVGGPGTDPDVLLILGADDTNDLSKAVEDIRARAAQAGMRLVWSEDGHKLGAGREHFGFHDGISQPGVRGTLAAIPGQFLTARTLDPSDPTFGDPNGPEYSAPGEPLVWPGLFVLGYSRQNSNDFRLPDEQPGPPIPSWARHGSFVVFRRLRQDVRQFRAFLSSHLSLVRAASGFEWVTLDALAAMLVGRWQSGAPVVRSPHADPGPVVGADDRLNNAFTYRNPFPEMKLASGFTVPPAPNDVFGTLCPFAAHIRKVNPRDWPADSRSAAETLTHRVLRRGIPFGPEYAEPDPVNGDRGLLFLCYQASIHQQFEFLQAHWMNSPSRPSGTEGHDILIGQSLDASNRSRWIALIPRIGARLPLTTMDDFVTVTGGGYFFAPGRGALREMAS